GPGSTAAATTTFPPSALRRTSRPSRRSQGPATRLTRTSEGKVPRSHGSHVSAPHHASHALRRYASPPTFGEVVIHYDPEPVSSHRVDMLLGVGPRRPRAPRE